MSSPEEPEYAPGPIRSLIASLANVLATIIGAVQTRLELFSAEMQEGARNAVALVLWALIALFAAGMALLLGALSLIFAFWETHRVLVSLLVTGGFLLIAVGAALMLRIRLKGQRRPFDATLTELAKDGERLRARFERREEP